MSVPTIAAVQDGRPRDNARSMAGTDVLLVSLGGTAGLRAADDELAGALRRAGASVAVARVDARRASVRTFALTDLAWALPARARGARGDARTRAPRAIVYSTTHRRAALAGAGRDPLRRAGGRQPARPPRDLAAPGGAPALRGRAAARCRGARARWPRRLRRARPALVVPVPVARSGPAGRARHRGDHLRREPATRRASTACSPPGARRGAPGETLVVAGRRAGATRTASATRACSRRPSTARCCAARASFVTAPRREDYGIAQLEALADGCLLVTTAAPGPYAALPLARALDPRLVGDDLAAAMRTALDDPSPGYAERARAALAPWTPAAVDAVVRRAAAARAARRTDERRPDVPQRARSAGRRDRRGDDARRRPSSRRARARRPATATPAVSAPTPSSRPSASTCVTTSAANSAGASSATIAENHARQLAAAERDRAGAP